MRTLSRKPTTWASVFLAILVVVLVLLFLGPARTAMNVAAVQNAVQRDWEISFGYSNGPGKPALLPTRLDTMMQGYFERHLGYTRGDTNRDCVAHERFRALFRSSIQEIHINDFIAFRGDLGAALVRFPDLRRLTLDGSGFEQTEAEWKQLCTHLRTLPNLEEIDLEGGWVTDAAIAPLAPHPQLRKVTIGCGRLTGDCAKIFASMPRLSELHIYDQIHDGDVWLSPEGQNAMRAALPGVIVELPEP